MAVVRSEGRRRSRQFLIASLPFTVGRRRGILSAAANGLKELGDERRGGRRGWAEGGGNPITETPAWTFPPPPTLSGRIGEGSLPPPARRGAEPCSGEKTLSQRVVVARAGALTWRRLNTSGAELAAQVGSRQGVWGSRRRVPVTPAYPACLSEGVLLPFRAEGPGGWEAGSSAQASPVSRRQAVCGVGRGLLPPCICGLKMLVTAVGWGRSVFGPTVWRGD